MKKVVNLYKPVSYTPLQVVEAFRATYPEYMNTKLGYAGRLDPMASGVLLVLVDQENFKRTSYERLPKAYEFEVLFGVSTDTYDVMGRVERVQHAVVSVEDVRTAAVDFEGVWKQEYPAYSSALVHGRPLYWWARNGRISEIELPSKRVNVEKIEVVEACMLSAAEVAQEAAERIAKTEGEFRQADILADWGEFGETWRQTLFLVVRMSIVCSSGVYVRSIAHSFGAKLGVPAVARGITRVRVGEFDLSSSVRIGSING